MMPAVQRRIGDVLNKLDRFEEALAAYRAGLRTYERLVAMLPPGPKANFLARKGAQQA